MSLARRMAIVAAAARRGNPDRSGGMSQLGASDAGPTGDPGSRVQPIEVYWSPAWTREARNTTRSSSPRSRGRNPALTGTARNWNLKDERQRAADVRRIW